MHVGPEEASLPSEGSREKGPVPVLPGYTLILSYALSFKIVISTLRFWLFEVEVRPLATGRK